MANFCSNCGAQLAQDSQVCTACNTPAEVAGGSYYEAAAAKVAAEASWSVPPFIWAGAIQVYWLVHGLWGLLSGTFLLGAFGMLGYSSAMRSGQFGGSDAERMVAMLFVGFVAGAFDVCVSIALVYGLLTLKRWAYRVFLIWLPVKVFLWIVGFLITAATRGTTIETPSQPTFITAITVVGVILQFGALLGGFMLVRSGKAALAKG